MRGKIRINEDSLFPQLVKGSLILTAALAIITGLAVSARFGASVFAGGMLATANFIWMRGGLEATLKLQVSTAPRVAIFRYLVRLAILAALLYLLIVKLGADLFGLLLGLSVLVITIIVFSIYLSVRKGG